MNVKGFSIILDNERSSRSRTSKPPFQLQFIINKMSVGSRAQAALGAGSGEGRNERGLARYRPLRPAMLAENLPETDARENLMNGRTLVN